MSDGNVFLGGNSDTKGFIVIDTYNRIWAGVTNGQLFSGRTTSTKYLKKIERIDRNVSLLRDPTFSVLLLLLWIFVLMPRFGPVEGLIGVVALLSLSLYSHLPGLRILIGKCDKNLKQWHSCEHKLIHLLERGEKVTETALRFTDPVHPRGKTTIVIGVWPIHIYFSIKEGKGSFFEPNQEQLELTVEVGKQYANQLSLMQRG